MKLTYNEYLRNYPAIVEGEEECDGEEVEGEDGEDGEDEDDEDYVPADGSEDEEEEEEEEEAEEEDDDIYSSIHKNLMQVNKYNPDILDKLTFAYLDTIYFTVLFVSNAISYVCRVLFKY